MHFNRNYKKRVSFYHNLFQQLVRHVAEKSRSLSLISLVAASFCIYQAQTEKKVGPHGELEIQDP